MTPPTLSCPQFPVHPHRCQTVVFCHCLLCQRCQFSETPSETPFFHANKKMQFLLPLLAVYLASALFGCDLSGTEPALGLVPRPPPWVFGVVWPILLLAMGVCAPSLKYWVLLACLVSWTPLKCWANKSDSALLHTVARIVLLASLWFAWTLSQECPPVWLMVGWLSYASLIWTIFPLYLQMLQKCLHVYIFLYIYKRNSSFYAWETTWKGTCLFTVPGGAKCFTLTTRWQKHWGAHNLAIFA